MFDQQRQYFQSVRAHNEFVMIGADVFGNPTLPPPHPEASGRAIYALPAGGKEETLLAYSLALLDRLDDL